MILEEEHRKHNLQHMQKWHIYRLQENERMDREVELARKQKRVRTWLTHLVLVLTLVNAHANKEELVARKVK